MSRDEDHVRIKISISNMALKQQHKTRQPVGSRQFFRPFLWQVKQELKKVSAPHRLETI